MYAAQGTIAQELGQMHLADGVAVNAVGAHQCKCLAAGAEQSKPGAGSGTRQGTAASVRTQSLSRTTLVYEHTPPHSYKTTYIFNHQSQIFALSLALQSHCARQTAAANHATAGCWYTVGGSLYPGS